MELPDTKSIMMFNSLVMMFSTQAMMAMGKLQNPMTGKVERDLNQAQIMIDMLEMVEARTKGNLTDDESLLLANTLRDLRLNFVVERNKDANPASPAADAPAVDASDAPAGQEGIPENVA